MKKLLKLMLLLVVVLMAGCFNQDKEKQEEKALEQEKVVTKSSPSYSGVKISLKQENKQYNLERMAMYYGEIMGKYVTPTVDTDVDMYTVVYNWLTDKEEAGVTIGTAKLLKGKKYLVYCGGGWQQGMANIEVIDTESRFVVNEKNDMFKMSFDGTTWHAINVQGSSFRIKDTQNNKYYCNGKVFTTLYNFKEAKEMVINPNKIYDISVLESDGFEPYIVAEKSIEQFKVRGNILAKDYIGYYDFYSGMKVKIISEKNEIVEVPVVWNTRTNTFGIEANGLKYGTYKIKSTYQAVRDGYIYGNNYGEGDKVLVEYTIDKTMVIDSKSTYYPLPEGLSLINFGDISVTNKVIKNLSKNFTSLAICGVYNNWDTKGNMTYKGSNNWEGDIEIKTLNNSVLFIADKNWNKQYGDANRDNIAELNKGDIKLQFAGKYHVVFNDSTLKYTVTLVSKTDLKKNFNEIAVYGAFNNWNSKGNMSFMGEHQWQYRLTATSNIQVKFLGDSNGSYLYGDKNKDGVAEIGGTAITLEKGSYQILFNDETLRYTLKKLN